MEPPTDTGTTTPMTMPKISGVDATVPQWVWEVWLPTASSVAAGGFDATVPQWVWQVWLPTASSVAAGGFDFTVPQWVWQVWRAVACSAGAVGLAVQRERARRT